MSANGTQRLKVKEIVTGKLRGKALSDALAEALTSKKVPTYDAKKHK